MNPRHTIWLVLLGIMMMLGVVSGAAPAPAIAVLAALFAAAVAVSILGSRQTAALVRQSRQALSGAVTEAASARRMSPEAREAAGRARARSTARPAADGDVMLLDIGVFTTDHGPDGVTMRRTRSVSLDEDSVRPFMTLQVSPRAADRQVVLRFELRDGQGGSQYIHEQQVYLRDGQMNIIADHQLALAGNPRISHTGEWDLRVSLDGVLVGAQAFTVTPPLERRFGPAATFDFDEAPARPVPGRLIETDGEPLTLEDLLRSQQNDQERRGRS